MKKIVFLLLFAAPIAFAAEIVMPRVNPALFIHAPQTDLEAITLKDAALKEKMVTELFEKDLLNHEGSKAYDTSARFSDYYKNYASYYRLIDLNNDRVPELIFNGTVTKDDQREYLEIYCLQNQKLVNIYNEIGHILAYKIHPNTKEILLFHHQYPCCANASHNLNRLRLIVGKMQLVKRYFVGRESDMKGKFFPDNIFPEKKYKRLSRQATLRWSGEVISKGAWARRNPDNILANYAPQSVYKILAEEKGWYFVLMHAAPIQEQSSVINPANFTETAIYGWLDKRTL